MCFSILLQMYFQSVHVERDQPVTAMRRRDQIIEEQLRANRSRPELATSRAHAVDLCCVWIKDRLAGGCAFPKALVATSRYRVFP
jgi:hypothetical protein